MLRLLNFYQCSLKIFRVQKKNWLSVRSNFRISIFKNCRAF